MDIMNHINPHTWYILNTLYLDGRSSDNAY